MYIIQSVFLLFCFLAVFAVVISCFIDCSSEPSREWIYSECATLVPQSFHCLHRPGALLGKLNVSPVQCPLSHSCVQLGCLFLLVGQCNPCVNPFLRSPPHETHSVPLLRQARRGEARRIFNEARAKQASQTN